MADCHSTGGFCTGGACCPHQPPTCALLLYCQSPTPAPETKPPQHVHHLNPHTTLQHAAACLTVTVCREHEGPPTPSDIDPKVEEVYRQVGVLLSRYTSGQVPKALKIIPALSNWEEVCCGRVGLSAMGLFTMRVHTNAPTSPADP